MTEEEVARAVKRVVSDSPAPVAAYCEGEDNWFGYLLGLVMAEIGGDADVRIVNQELHKFLKECCK